MEIKATNVNDAFDKGVELMSTPLPLWTRKVAPRGIETLEVVEPVITHYMRPTERVLFSPARDANPFLHFFESLWMLAGRRDVAFLKLFTSRMTEFSDNGYSFNGAYGWRWRYEFDYDQLTEVISLLRHDLHSRRAVITMWTPWGDLKQAGDSKDIPCNTQVYVKIRDSKLDITVTCRSNDMLWGCYGANVVQFSMLQEYLANKLGVAVGRYTQFSDSLHVYLPPHPEGLVWERVLQRHVSGVDPYSTGSCAPYPLGAGDMRWDGDMKAFFYSFENFYNPKQVRSCDGCAGFETDFWRNVVRPMWITWHTRNVMDLAQCAASDWRLAGTEWLGRRSMKMEK